MGRKIARAFSKAGYILYMAGGDVPTRLPDDLNNFHSGRAIQTIEALFKEILIFWWSINTSRWRITSATGVILPQMPIGISMLWRRRRSIIRRLKNSSIGTV